MTLDLLLLLHTTRRTAIEHAETAAALAFVLGVQPTPRPSLDRYTRQAQFATVVLWTERLAAPGNETSAVAGLHLLPADTVAWRGQMRSAVAEAHRSAHHDARVQHAQLVDHAAASVERLVAALEHRWHGAATPPQQRLWVARLVADVAEAQRQLAVLEDNLLATLLPTSYSANPTRMTTPR